MRRALLISKIHNKQLDLLCTYTTTKVNQNVKIINNVSLAKSILLEDGTELTQTENNGYYTFNNKGEHKVRIEFYSGIVDFSNCFLNCEDLTNIPTDLFSSNLNAVNFYECFRGCTALQSIPEGLFSNNPNVTSFSSCFNRCSSLQSIPEGLFSNNPNVTSFSYCFRGCTALTGGTPKDTDGGELWERAGKEGYPSTINGMDCFYNCTKLSNYSEIPKNWK